MFPLFFLLQAVTAGIAASSWLPALIAGASSAATGLIGTAMNNKARKSEAELAYRRERQAIQEQRVYNSASSQMARLQAAGLNPNLMYENGQEAAAGTQDDIARYSPADYESGVAPVGAVGADFINSVIGLKDMENQTILRKSQVALNASTAKLNETNCHVGEATAKRIIELLGLEKTQMYWNAELLREKGLTEVEYREQVKMSTAELAKRMEVEEAEIAKLDAQTQEILKLLSYKMDYMKANTAQSYALCAQALAASMYYSKSTEMMPKQLAQGYWKIGADALVSVLGFASKFIFKGASLGQVFGNNPWQILENMSGDAYGSLLPGE